MIPEMQLVITENKQIIKTLTKEMNTHGSHLVKSLQEFRQLVNAAITQVIEDHGDNNQDENEDSNEDCSEDDNAVPVTPKKRKK